MKKVSYQSPTRIDLAGGTLDCWPLYCLFGGAKTINLGIDVKTEVHLSSNDQEKILVICPDLKYQKSFNSWLDLLGCPDNELTLLKPHISYWKPDGVTIELHSESPIGGGLGGSSSLCISLIKAFTDFYDKNLSDWEMVSLARDLETQILGKPAGTQDYIPALKGGLCLIDYKMGSVEWESPTIDMSPLESCLSLVYTGQPHHSGLNNWEIIKGALEGDEKVLGALNQINQVAEQMSSLVKNFDIEEMGRLFTNEFSARMELSTSYINERILKLKELALDSGAKAIKVCGAGGGGCVLVLSPPEVKKKVEGHLSEADFSVLDYKIWRLH